MTRTSREDIDHRPGVVAAMQVLDAHAKFQEAADDYSNTSGTVYLPIWHKDLEQYIQCASPDHEREIEVDRLSTALLIPDIL